MAFVCTLMSSPASYADDTEVYFGAGTKAVRPNILFVMDTSGSMSSGVPNSGGRDRLEVMQDSLTRVLDSIDNVNVGLMRYSSPGYDNNGGPILYPVRYIDDEVQEAIVSSQINSDSDDASQDQLAPLAPLKLDEPAIFLAENVSSGQALGHLGLASDYSETDQYGSNRQIGQTASPPHYATLGAEKIGFRFVNLAIPQGADITHAAIDMEANKAGNEASVAILLENDVAPNTYSVSPSADTAADRTNYLSSFVPWPVQAGAKGDIHSTPDLSSLVEQVVKKPGWNDTSNALAFQFEPRLSPLNADFCTPSLYDCTELPILTVDWKVNPEDNLVGLRFTNVFVPQGATIKSARIDFTASGDSTGNTAFTIQGHKVANSPTFSAADDLNGRSLTSSSASWTGFEAWADQETYHSADFSNVVQEIVEQPDWCGGNAMTLILSGDGSRKFVTHEGDSGSAPKLIIEFDKASANGGCTRSKVFKQVAYYFDDVDLDDVNHSNKNHDELNFDKDTFIGVRFSPIAIPKGATILNANIQFKAKKGASVPTETELYRVQASNQWYFDTSDPNKNLDKIKKSGLHVDWDPGTWAAEDVITTPDISPLVQDLVNQASWSSGNSMAFVVKITDGAATGGEAYSYDGRAANAATLTINYEGSFQNDTLKVRDHLKTTVANFNHSGWTPISGTMAEAALYYKGEAVKFGKRRGNPNNSSYSDKFRTSHEGSYTGGTLNIPFGCPGWDSNHSTCRSMEITGNPVYKSPIEDVCQTNHIVFLSDGYANSHGNINAGVAKQIMNNSVSCKNNDGGDECSIELARYLANNNASAPFSGVSPVTTHTISFASHIPLLDKMADASGSHINPTTHKGEAYLAENEDELVTALQEIVKTVLDSASSFVSAGVSVNQFNQLTNDDELYFALFEPSGEVSWPGNLKRYGYNANTREILDINGQKAVVNGRFQDNVTSYWKTSGKPDGADVKLGGAVASMGLGGAATASGRNIYTNMGTYDNLTHAKNKVDETNLDITETLLGVTNAADREKALRWARGFDVNDVNEDGSTTDFRLEMGDPLHSRPMLVKYDTGAPGPSRVGTAPNDYSTDETVAFVATNQGYLHAINASNGNATHTDDGNELWAFIPRTLLDNLHIYRTNPEGQAHPYGLDGHITISHDDTDHDGLIDTGEKAILYVGMRRGGNNYYAIDITTKNAPKLLFRIEGGTGDYAELGETWSAATPATIKWNGNPKNVIIFGGGYDTGQDTKGMAPIADAQGRTVFVADAETGALLWSARTDALAPSSPWPASSSATSTLQNSIPGDIKAIDFNNNGFVDTLYAADTNAQVFRFDIDEANTGKTDFATGARIAHLNEATVAGNRRFYYSVDPSLVVLNNGDRFVAVSVGSGYRAHPLDDQTSEHFYVLRDYGVLNRVFDADIALGDLADVSEAAKDEQADLLINTTGNKGWYIDLSNPNVGKPGEKVTATSLTVNNTVIFSTYIPPQANPGACTPSEGSGRFWFVDILDGTPIESRVADITNPQLEERHTDEISVGLPPGALPLFTEDGLVISAGQAILEAPPPPPGDPLKVYRRRKGTEPLVFP